MTLYFATIPFIISARLIGLPSLELDSSMSVRVKLSEARGCLAAAGLIRGPVLVPQAGLAGGEAAGTEGASDGNASWDSVSTWG